MEKQITIALAGNPNSGKTTLFNALTGSNQFVGNWPGVTVEKKEGKLKGKDGVTITDLPGIYSLSPYTLEEVVARNYLIDERPDAILNIVDGTNLERNLYLTTQLIEIGLPVVVAINMMDMVRKNGDKIDVEGLSKKLGCKVVEISALKEDGIISAAEIAVEEAKKGKRIVKHIFSGAVEHAIAHIEESSVHHLPEDRQRWYAIKIFERDEKVLSQLSLDKEKLAHIETDIVACEKELDDDAESIITNERYLYIEKILNGIYVRKNAGKLTLSDKIDKVVTNRILALPIFAIIMFLVYYISVTTVGTWVTDFTNDGLFGDGFNFFGVFVPGVPVLLTNGLQAINCAPWLISLIVDGIVAGVGAVIGFVPQILVLFLILAFLEACGYMSRIAFVLDRIFRKFGLSGKSFIPILIGTGCGVPGIMASRTIENDRDRKMTIITTTFIPCGAKLPFIALIASVIFGGAWWVAPLAYFIGMGAIIFSGIMLKKTKLFKGDVSPFVMELPPYHMPPLKNVLRSMWERGWSFIKKAGTIILLSTVVIWFLTYFGFTEDGFRMLAEEEIDKSILAVIGNLIGWIFTPLGFGNWQSAVATITGLIAKENIVGTLGVVYGVTGDANLAIAGAYTQIAGLSFLIFNLLCAPCFAAIGAIRREMNNWKWTLFAVGYQTVFAYAISLIVYQLGNAFTGNVNVIGVIIAVLLILILVYLVVKPDFKKMFKKAK
ncbi:MAG: ferrous iron transport protein B [Clostridiales bacterium]|nr:ferrous iron transport protein B [Clostridiales bacterium]